MVEIFTQGIRTPQITQTK